jgi:uncharacterized glyoxalase superfamily protein PhnB
MKFTGICLITNNVNRLAEFYANILGIESEGNEVHAELKTEGANISIFSVQGMEGMAPHSMQGAGHGSVTIGFEVQDLLVEYQRLEAMGIEFLMRPTAHAWGSSSFWFRDPDGNIVDFYTTQSKQ